MSEQETNIPNTFGALLIGGIVAASFTGVVTSQVYSYYKMFPADRRFIKALVFAVWLLDLAHTGFVVSTMWDHFITAFGNPSDINRINWSLAMTVAVTAVLTLLVHCFSIHRIHKLSLNNWFISVPLSILAVLRVAFACLTTVQMIKLRSIPLFIQHSKWSFTLGLMISSILDIFHTGLLCWLLMRSQKGSSNLNHILDKLMLYAFENGCLTTAATFISLLCWLIMPSNLIFMALHFVISKFYANSLLATLNRRKELQKPQVYTSKESHGAASHRTGSRVHVLKLKEQGSFTPVMSRRSSRGTEVTLSPSQSTFSERKVPSSSKLSEDPEKGSFEADRRVHGDAKNRNSTIPSPTHPISIYVSREIVALDSDFQCVNVDTEEGGHKKETHAGEVV